MAREEQKPIPSESIHGAIFSPRFKSVAAMAGWDEESLLYASLTVDDTPDRDLSHKKRTVFQFKTPPTTNSRKKRRAQSSAVVPIPIVALDLDDIEASKNVETQKDTPKVDKKEKEKENEEKGDIVEDKSSGVSTSLPYMDKLREELSCAICLDICFEPSTTPCGHSFCLKCLRFSASKCGKKCPKCRQLISNGRACTVNTVLWNTIQLLFPQEVEAKKAAGSSNSRESEGHRKIPETAFYDNLRNGSSDNSELPRSSEETSARRRRSTQSRNEDPTASLEREIRRNIRAASRVTNRDSRARTGRTTPSQDEDAALALRLQREEFMGAVMGTSTIQTRTSAYNPINTNSTSTNSSLAFNQSSTTSTNPTTSSNSSSSFSLARANLRAMASRAITLRVRRQF